MTAPDPECTSAAQCSPGQSCEDGKCVGDPMTCFGDDDCPAGTYCDYLPQPPCECPDHYAEPGDEEAGRAACLCATDALWAGGQCMPDNKPPVECTSDLDCGAGLVCELTEICADMCGVEPAPGEGDGEVPDDMKKPGDCWACAVEGICVEDTQPQDCWSDYDCDPGEYCDYYMYGGGGAWAPCECDCGDDEDCVCLPCEAPAGQCIPLPDPPKSECYDDDDCAPGQVCELLESCGGFMPFDCDGDTDCIAPCEMIGLCVDAPESECFEDADCDEGFVCELGSSCDDCPCDYDGDSDVPCACACTTIGYCVDKPIEPPVEDCFDDSECGQGMVCQLPDPEECWYDCDCGYGPDNGDGEADPAVCYCEECYVGQCVPAPLDGCVSDADCPEGQFCAWLGIDDEEVPAVPGGQPLGMCVDDAPMPSDTCVVSGCSGQICSAEPMATTCEWLPQYACYELSECGSFGWFSNILGRSFHCHFRFCCATATAADSIRDR